MSDIPCIPMIWWLHLAQWHLASVPMHPRQVSTAISVRSVLPNLSLLRLLARQQGCGGLILSGNCVGHLSRSCRLRGNESVDRLATKSPTIGTLMINRGHTPRPAWCMGTHPLMNLLNDDSWSLLLRSVILKLPPSAGCTPETNALCHISSN